MPDLKTISRPPEHGFLSLIPQTWVPYAELMRLDRPFGIFLFYFPYLFGLLFAANTAQPTIPPFQLLATSIHLLLTAVILRGAACTWNDIQDREYDRLVPRTAMRPLPRGAVTSSQAHLHRCSGSRGVLHSRHLAMECGVQRNGNHGSHGCISLRKARHILPPSRARGPDCMGRMLGGCHASDGPSHDMAGSGPKGGQHCSRLQRWWWRGWWYWCIGMSIRGQLPLDHHLGHRVRPPGCRGWRKSGRHVPRSAVSGFGQSAVGDAGGGADGGAVDCGRAGAVWSAVFCRCGRCGRVFDGDALERRFEGTGSVSLVVPEWGLVRRGLPCWGAAGSVSLLLLRFWCVCRCMYRILVDRLSVGR